MSRVRELTLADGQLGAAAATIVSGADVPSHYVNVLLTNVSGNDNVEVTLTFQRAGGTARRLARRTLDNNESVELVNWPIAPDDTLLGVASLAASVDYIVTQSTNGRPTIITRDEAGAIKHHSVGTSTISGTLDVAKARGIEHLLAELLSLTRRQLLCLQDIVGSEMPDPETV